jgi:hypothetical protein
MISSAAVISPVILSTSPSGWFNRITVIVIVTVVIMVVGFFLRRR